MTVNVDRLEADHGSVVLFSGTTDDGERVTFAADHRPAQSIAFALEHAPGDVRAEVDTWQILSRGGRF